MAVRLYALVARQARRALVFRRGPSKQVLLLSWDLEREVVRKGDTRVAARSPRLVDFLHA